jgi:ribosomal protein S18 acetylase RimI-like enzyme
MSGVSNVVLRRANVADASAIAAVRVEAWRVTYRGVIPDSYLDEMRVEDSTELWLRVLSAPANPGTAVFVAEVDGRIVGFSAGMIMQEQKFGFDAELTAIYLIPDAQERGLGTRLVRMVANGFANLGVNGMLVWVLAENKVARQFYEKLGGELLIEQAFSWDGLDLQEVGYGFRDLTTLAL